MASPGSDRIKKNSLALINQDDTTQSTVSSGTTAKTIAGSVIDFPPGYVGRGLVYKIILAGTKTSTNGVHTVTLLLGTTTLMTLTSEAATASDWQAQFHVMFTSGSAQKVTGWYLAQALAVACDYAVGTVDCHGGVQMKCQITPTSGDTIKCEMCLVEEMASYMK